MKTKLVKATSIQVDDYVSVMDTQYKIIAKIQGAKNLVIVGQNSIGQKESFLDSHYLKLILKKRFWK
jgi:hypothetical protein